MHEVHSMLKELESTKKEGMLSHRARQLCNLVRVALNLGGKDLILLIAQKCNKNDPNSWRKAHPKSRSDLSPTSSKLRGSGSLNYKTPSVPHRLGQAGRA